MTSWSYATLCLDSDQLKGEDKDYGKEKCYVCQESVVSNSCYDVNSLLPKTDVSIGSMVLKVLKPSLTSWARIQTQYLCELCMTRFHSCKIEEDNLAKLCAEIRSLFKACCALYKEDYYENGTAERSCQTEDAGVHSSLDKEEFMCHDKTDYFELSHDDCASVSVKQENESSDVTSGYEKFKKTKGRRKRKNETPLWRKRRKVKRDDVMYSSEELNTDCEYPLPSIKKRRGRVRKKYTCVQCCLEYKRPSELRNHELIVHKKRNPNICPQCARTFGNRNALYTHLKNKHFMTKQERMAVIEENEAKLKEDLNHAVKSPPHSEIEEDSQERHKDRLDAGCYKDWDVSSLRKNRKSDHIKTETQPEHPNGKRKRGRPKKPESERVRLRNRAGERYLMPLIFECEYCGKKWRTKAELRGHIQTHSKLKPWVCEICGQSFKLQKALLIHVGMHRGIHPYICHYCNKSFTQKGGLVRHMNIHLKTRVYTCELCGKSFFHKTSFSAHRLVHTGARPAKCNQCGLALTTFGHLNTHILVHTGQKPFECHLCGRKFAKKWNRDVHTRKLHGVEPEENTKIVDSSDGPVVDIRNTAFPIQKISLGTSSTDSPFSQDVLKRKANVIIEPGVPYEPMYLQY